jgi:hypothetical protein
MISLVIPQNRDNRAIILERLEAELLGNHDSDHIHEANIPPPSTSKFPNAGAFPSTSQHPALHWDHVAIGRVPQMLPPTPAPLLYRSWEKNLEVSCGKRKS